MKQGGDVVGILLAAGRSRRFGGDKLLHPLADGTPMALASAAVLRAVLPRTVAVVRPDHEALTALFTANGIDSVIARRADDGMGASLAAGVAATADAAAWIVSLGDMPFIQPQTISCIADALRHGAALAAPMYHGRRGHPVGFSARYRDELLALCEDQGARAVLQRDAHELLTIECRDPGVLLDIDRPATLAGTAR